MHNGILTIVLLLTAHLFLSEQVWHVSGSGNDSNDGRSHKTAFRTLQKAASLVKPGDVVSIGDGVYTDTGNGMVVLYCLLRTPACPMHGSPGKLVPEPSLLPFQVY